MSLDMRVHSNPNEGESPRSGLQRGIRFWIPVSPARFRSWVPHDEFSLSLRGSPRLMSRRSAPDVPRHVGAGE